MPVETRAAAPPSVIRVFLVDDHEIVRRGVAALLRSEADIAIAGEAGNAREALARIPAARPHVVVLDVRLPDGDGVEVCRRLRSMLPEVACLMLTSYADDDALFKAVMGGAAGYVLKQIHGCDLAGAIRTVAAGKSLLDPASTGRVMNRMRRRQAVEDPLSGLTPQERRIVELIGDGLTNRQIGARLHIAEKTVKNNVTSIFDKLDMTRRTQAAALAARMRAASRTLGGRSSGGRSSGGFGPGVTSPRSGPAAHSA